jgi:hypothetical protein
MSQWYSFVACRQAGAYRRSPLQYQGIFAPPTAVAAPTPAENDDLVHTLRAWDHPATAFRGPSYPRSSIGT